MENLQKELIPKNYKVLFTEKQLQGRIKELADDGGTGCPEPDHSVPGEIPEKPENSDVYQLGNNKSGYTAEDDEHALSENGGKLLITYNADLGIAVSGNFNGNKEYEKGITYKGRRDYCQFPYPLPAVILVDDVGGEEYNGPEDHSNAQNEALKINDLASDKLGNNRIADKYPCKYNINKVSLGTKCHLNAINLRSAIYNP